MATRITQARHTSSSRLGAWTGEHVELSVNDDPALAEGFARISCCGTPARRGATAAAEAARLLLADRDAHRITYPRPAGLTVSKHLHRRRRKRKCRCGFVSAGGNWRDTGDRLFPWRRIQRWQHRKLWIALATALAEASGALVVSVLYPRSPRRRRRKRAALEICYAAMLWTMRMVGALKIDPDMHLGSGGQRRGIPWRRIARSSRPRPRRPATALPIAVLRSSMI